MANAHDALTTRQKAYGFKRALPDCLDGASRSNLLSGFARCGVCGGSIVQSWMALQSVYRCWYNWSRGPAVCTNTLTVRQDCADLTVLRAVERDVLDREVVEAGLFLSLQHLTRSDELSARRRDEPPRDELARIETGLARYADAIADAGPLDTILAAIRVREDRREAIRHELKALTPQRPGEKDPDEIRATLARYLGDWTRWCAGAWPKRAACSATS